MNKIYKVTSNIKHNGEDIKKGSFVEEFVGANTLAADGVLKLVEGATTLEEAVEIDAEEIAKAGESVEEEVAPQNTWEPKKDEEEAVEIDAEEKLEDEVYTGPMEYYKVVGEVHPLNEDGTEKEETLEIGSIHYLPTNAVDLESDNWTLASDEEIESYNENLNK